MSLVRSVQKFGLPVIFLFLICLKVCCRMQLNIVAILGLMHFLLSNTYKIILQGLANSADTI